MRKIHRIRFVHLFVLGALIVTAANLAIGGFRPRLPVLIPALPFCVLAVLPVSRKVIGAPDTAGIIGAGIGAFISSLPVTILFAYDTITGWKGGADIGLGLLYLFLPAYATGLLVIGYLAGELTLLIRYRNLQRSNEILGTLSILLGIGACAYFLLRSQASHTLLTHYATSDPSAAEVHEVDFWRYVLLAGASLLAPLAVLVIRRRHKG